MPDIFDASNRANQASNSSSHSSTTKPEPDLNETRHHHQEVAAEMEEAYLTIDATPSPAELSQAESAEFEPLQQVETQLQQAEVIQPTDITQDMNNQEEKSAAPRPKRHVDEYSTVMCSEVPSTNPFNAFAAKPAQVFFDSQHREEKVILLLRQHPITQLPWIFTAIGLGLLPFLFSVLPFVIYVPPAFQLAGIIGWYALVFSFILESFLMWFFNVYIITDERIIDVDFYSLVYKNVSSAKIDNIEDITAVTGGTLRSIFNYGTIKIQTAAANTEFEFTDVPQQAKVTALLNELLIEEEREKNEGRVS